MSQKRRAEVLSTDTPELFDAAVARAAAALRAGQVVALPTETVYGLAANAWDSEAVRRIFEVKGRPAHNPVIVHVASLEMARRCVRQWPAAAEALARAFWPGPLTLVLPKADEIPSVVTAGGATVGVRWPSHPFIQAVIRACGFPLAAPSANPATALSPTNAAHVLRVLGQSLDLIVDGGQSRVGIESTVLDLSVRPLRVLRPGMIHAESLCAVLGEELSVAGARGEGEPLRSPGQLLRHYSPRARMSLCSWKDDADLRQQVARLTRDPSKVHVVAHRRIPAECGFGRVSLIPHDAEAFARAIYAELHRCDEEGAEWIVVESVPEGPEWRAVADRLRRGSVQPDGLGAAGPS